LLMVIQPWVFLEQCREQLKKEPKSVSTDSIKLPEYSTPGNQHQDIPKLAFQKYKYHQQKNYSLAATALAQNVVNNAVDNLVFTVSIFHPRLNKKQAQFQFLGSHSLQTIQSSFLCQSDFIHSNTLQHAQYAPHAQPQPCFFIIENTIFTDSLDYTRFLYLIKVSK